MTIAYLFRSRGTGHSIEALFSGLRAGIEQHRNVTTTTIWLPFISRGLHSVWQNLRFAATLKADVFHITGDIHYAVLALPPSRTVLTIHDCITLKNNQNRPFRYAVFWLLWYYLPIRRAAVVTVVSEKTRQELIQYVGLVAKKAVVIPNSYDPTFSYQPARIRKGTPVLLQIGTAPHKNLANLIASIEGINCVLVIIGSLTETLIADLKQRRIKYRNYVNLDRENIRQWYINCDIVTFISTYEGFGMPVLEANAIGRPVITSNLLPMRDVADEAAHLVNPTDTAAIRQGILRLIQDDAYRQLLVEAGVRNIQRYTTTSIAKQYVALYKQLHQHQPLSEVVS